MNIQDWFPLGLTGLISLLSMGLSRVFSAAAATAAAKSRQSCLTLCDPIDGSPPGSSVPGILQARILEWVSVPSPMHACRHAQSLQSCPTLCDPMDCSLPGSSVHRIFQARVLEWGAIAFSITTLEIGRTGVIFPHCHGQYLDSDAGKWNVMHKSFLPFYMEKKNIKAEFQAYDKIICHRLWYTD